jgi:hypothetical protein
MGGWRAQLLRRGLFAMLLTVGMAGSAGALAAPGGQGQGQALGLGQGVGSGNAHKPDTSKASQTTGSTGSPHQGGGYPNESGVSGKSQTKGSTDSPDQGQGSAPHGVAAGNGSGGGALVSSTDKSSSANAGGGGSPSSQGNGNGPPGKTTICHATGSASNPFVVITPANPGVQNGHAGHQDGRDIIPAPPGATKGPHATGCAQISAPVLPPTPPVLPPTPPVLPPTQSNPPGQGGVAGTPPGQGGVKPGAHQGPGGVTGGGNPRGGAAANVAGGPKGELPFTGLAASLLLTVGTVLLFGGWLVRSLGLREGPPYVVITPANPGAQNGHAGHQDGRDIIPAPPGATKGPHATGCAQISAPVLPPTPPVLPPTPGNPPAQHGVAGRPKGELLFTGPAASLLLTVGTVLLFGGWLVRSQTRRPR